MRLSLEEKRERERDDGIDCNVRGNRNVTRIFHPMQFRGNERTKERRNVHFLTLRRIFFIRPDFRTRTKKEMKRRKREEMEMGRRKHVFYPLSLTSPSPVGKACSFTPRSLGHSRCGDDFLNGKELHRFFVVWGIP